MIFLFEDAETSPLSVLLRHVLKSQKVEFSGTNGQLKDTAETIIAEKLLPNEGLFIFVDVVPDNLVAVTVFTRLVHYFEAFSNVFVVPWFSAEYHMLKLLNRALNDTEIADFLCGCETVRYGDKHKKNLEKVSKYILEDVTKQKIGCTLNRANTSGLSETNLFYTTDCVCTDCVLNYCGKSLEQKACELYTTLFMKVYSDTEFPKYLSEIYSWNVTTYTDALKAFVVVFDNIKKNLRDQGKRVFDLEVSE